MFAAGKPRALAFFLLAMTFLGEAFHAFHAIGIATILAGVIVAMGAARRR